MKIDNPKDSTYKQSDKLVQDNKNTNMLLAAFIMFIFPIIVIVLGALIGGFIGKEIKISTTISQVIGGALGLVVSAIVIKLFDKSSKSDKNAKKIEWDDL